MKKKGLILLFVFLALAEGVLAAPLRDQGQWIASFLTISAILVSLPAFVSLYLHIRKTNLGNLVFQPLLAMFIGFIGIMLNSLVGIWRSQSGFEVDDFLVVMGINRAISSVLIAAGCVMLFFSLKRHGLFDYRYYQKGSKKHKSTGKGNRTIIKG